nr:hypothetical protein [Tanacetum cinerariifolium]
MNDVGDASDEDADDKVRIDVWSELENKIRLGMQFEIENKSKRLSITLSRSHDFMNDVGDASDEDADDKVRIDVWSELENKIRLGMQFEIENKSKRLRKVIETMYGTWESKFDMLPEYIAALEASNPNTVVKWFHDPYNSANVVTFNAFRLCPPIISIDGAHLKGSYKGKLLVAVTKDANNNILPIAYAIIDEETAHSFDLRLHIFVVVVDVVADFVTLDVELIDFTLPKKGAYSIIVREDILLGKESDVSTTTTIVAPPAQGHGKKRAVLCGVTYNNHKKKLEASIYNVKCMQQLLVNKLGFLYASIRILTAEESDRSRIPTKRNIEEALRWLVHGCQSGDSLRDSLMFYYSGHGTRVRDQNGDEIDGYDEALCPVDYKEAGMIVDDDINATIVAPLTYGVTLHCVIDTCFSGTVLDLPFHCKINEEGLYLWEEHQLTNKGTSGGKALCISACADDQNSADTSVSIHIMS